MALERLPLFVEDGFFSERWTKKMNHYFGCRSSDQKNHLEQGMALERLPFFVEDGFFSA
jgi:hypothetical protein